MNKLNIKAYNIQGKNNDEIMNIIVRYPFYISDKEANKKMRKRFVFEPENLSGEVLTKIYINDDIIVGVEYNKENGEYLHLHHIERELQLIDVYEFPY